MKTRQKKLNKYLVAIAQPLQRKKRAISTLALLVCTLGYFSQPAHAEGSRELTASGGDRPFLEFSPNTNAGIPRRTTIKVFANVGETINLGSSANGIGAGVINYRRPNNTNASCPITTNIGRITTRAQELAGPTPNAGGYTPCIITVGAGQAGVWEVDFVAPAALSNPTPILANANWPPQLATQGFVTAWDVTVRSSTGTTINGRAFAKYIALNMGGNGRALSSRVTILTRDGYQYSIDANGLDPFGFIFYADDNGFTDASGNSLYRSIQLTGANPGNLPAGVAQPNPGGADNLSDITHKIFFNRPDLSMPSSSSTPSGTTWLYSLPIPPPVPSNFQFVGSDGTPSQSGTGLGGNFSFNASSAGPYRLVIDINQDNILGNSNDRVLIGNANAGANTVFWDGRDGNGAIVQPSASFYRTTITLYAGEIHFPLIDAETNPTGIIFERLNSPTPATIPAPSPYTVYFDDRALNPSVQLNPDGSNPLNGLGGVTDATGAHDFAVDFGNIRGIDTWSYYPSVAVELVGGVTVATADLSITKTHSPAQIRPGAPLIYTIRITNNSTTTYGSSAVVADTFNAAVTGVTWTCAITTQGTGSNPSSCANASGTGNINSGVSLRAGGVATFTINATLDPNFAGNTLSNTATISRSFDAAEPNLTNNTATDVAPIVRARMRLVKRITAINSTALTNVVNDPNDPNDDPAVNWPVGYLQGEILRNSVRPQDEVEYTIYFLSDGNTNSTNVTVCDLVPLNMTFAPTAFNSVTPALGGLPVDRGIVVSYNGSTLSYTNANDGDTARFYSVGSVVSTPSGGISPQPCIATNTPINGNGAIVVNVGTVPNSTGSGTPITSFGFIRFRAKVN